MIGLYCKVKKINEKKGENKKKRIYKYSLLLKIKIIVSD